MTRHGPMIAAGILLLASGGIVAEPVSGWRGNMTGLWPDAHPPLEWHRIPKGAMDGLRARASAPTGHEAADAPLVSKGLIRDWLIVGPFPVADSVKDFDSDLLDGETTVTPTEGRKVGELAWNPATVRPDDITVFGTAALPWLDLAKPLGFKNNQIAYAHTYVYSPRGGPVRFVADHGQGMKAWVNGKEVYRNPDRRVVLGGYPAISQHELRYSDESSARFSADLKPGWNRVLLKLSTPNKVGHTEMQVCLRVMDPPDVKYDEKNIRWMTPLPGRSTSTPILVADRLFVLAEPDELLCVDKLTGKVLWSAAVNYYEALSADEKRAEPRYAEQVDPLVARLRAETDPARRLALRADIRKTLLGIDANRFRTPADGHFEAHFGIVGFTMPTPVSDGTHVYVWNGMGVAACFDLAGNREWITRIKAGELTYGSSPALVDGVLVVYLNGLFGLDAKTGKQLWQQKRVRNNIASLLGATVGGQPVVITQRGDLIRPSNGEILFRPTWSAQPGDVGWSPPVILGNHMYAPRHGVTNLSIFDLSTAKPDRWEPRLEDTIQLPESVSRGEGGKWIDRSTPASPLIHDGLVYNIDIYQILYVTELFTKKMLYRQELPMDGLTHYNAVAVAASPTLVGKHILLCDNQGTTLIIEPGPKYRLVAKNTIGTVLDRRWPIPSQETLTYAPPLADGDRLYLRGEAYLYCIGEK